MALSANDLGWYAARLAIAVYETKRITPEMLIHEMREALKDIPGYEDLEIEFEPNGHQLLKIGGKVLEVGPAASNAEIILALKNTLVRTENTKVVTVTSSPIDRLRSKALQAKGVVPRVIAKVEADLDSVIAAEPELNQQADTAFAPHFEAIAQTKTELDGIKSALDIMSNGGPPLDPLPGSGTAAPGSKQG